MANALALTLVLILVAAGRNAGLAGAQSVPPSSSSCTAPLASLSPCLNFLQGGANNSSPTQGCCTSLASVVKTSAACLCQLVTTTNNSLGISVNQTRALSLPGACKLTTPPLSQCNSSAVSNPPASAPSAPSPSPVVSNPTPKAKSPAPATSAALPPTTTSATPPTKTPTTGGALSPPTTEGPTASTSAGSMTGVSMFIHVAGIMGSLLYIIFASI